MNFTPLTEEEIQTASLLPEGTYQYEVLQSEDRLSKKGNQYTSIILKVWDANGMVHNVFTNMSLIKLLKHFCDVNNMQDKYASGSIHPNEFLDKSGGLVVIGIEGEKPDGNGGMYKAKNIVKDYVLDSAPRPSQLSPIKPEGKDFHDDDIPF